MSKYIDDLRQIQKQYFAIINSFEIPESDTDFCIKAIALIDRCEAFWLSKKTQLSLILEELTRNKKCFLLSGAIYLDVEGGGHYTFGALGDINLLNDPIIRMRGFFAYGLEGINEHTRAYFCDAFTDIKKIENNFSDEFIFISIDIMYDSLHYDNSQLIDKVYWDVVSDMINRELRSVEDLFKEFSSVNEIEKCISKEKLGQLIFYDVDDIDLSLSNRINKYFEDSQLPVNIPVQNEIARFCFAVFAQIQQTVEIIFKCLQFDLFPFIRNDVTMRYFMLIGGAFPEDIKLKEIVVYSMLGYLYSSYVESDNVYKLDFKMFYQKCKQERFISNVYNRVCCDGREMYSMHIVDVVQIVRDEFDALLDKS